MMQKRSVRFNLIRLKSLQVPSGIETLLRQKSGSPGPGYYDLDDNIAAKSLSAISKARGIRSPKRTEFKELLETFC